MTARPGLASESASILVATVFSSALSLAFLLIVANAAGVEARGGLAFLVTVATLLSFAATMGLETANLHYAARTPDRRAALAGVSIVRGLAAGALLAAGAGGLLVVGSAIVPDGVPAWAVVLALATTPVMCVQFLLVSLLTGSGELRSANLVRALMPALSLATFGGLAAAGHRSIGSAAVAWCAGQAAGAAGAVWSASRRVGRPAFGAAARTLPGVTGYGLRAHIGNLADLATFRVDTLVLAAWWGGRELGIYAAAVNVAEVVLYLPTAVATVLLPHRSAPGRASRAVALRTTAVVAAATALVAGAGALAAPWLVDLLYPDAFSPAAAPLKILLLAMVGMSVRRVLAAELAAVRRQGTASAIAVVTFVAVLGLDLLLIPDRGAPGAAWASAAGYLLGGALIAAAVLGPARARSGEAGLEEPADPVVPPL